MKEMAEDIGEPLIQVKYHTSHDDKGTSSRPNQPSLVQIRLMQTASQEDELQNVGLAAMNMFKYYMAERMEERKSSLEQNLNIMSAT